jgi:hypothetical protein
MHICYRWSPLPPDPDHWIPPVTRVFTTMDAGWFIVLLAFLFCRASYALIS